MTSTVSQEDPPTGITSNPDDQANLRDTVLIGRSHDSWLALAGIVALGGISGIAYYLGFVQPYLLEANYRQPLQDLAKLSGHTGRSANEWAITWIVLFACYILAFRLCP